MIKVANLANYFSLRSRSAAIIKKEQCKLSIQKSNRGNNFKMFLEKFNM